MRARALAAAAALAASGAAARAEGDCGIGHLLRPAESCVLTLHWNIDHWVMADFPAGRGGQVAFSHVGGACRIALFGPAGTEDAQLGPNQPPTRRGRPGEYHLFARQIEPAREECRFRVAVE